MNTVDILGTDYKLVYKDYPEDPAFEQHGYGAYCDTTAHSIVQCNMVTFPGWEQADPRDIRHQEQLLLRHEIVHAFLFQSGLSANSNATDAWATNEEMVDWIALQGPKIYKAWKEACAL